MPQALQTLDQIARAKQRDVMCVTFHQTGKQLSYGEMNAEVFDWQTSMIRKEVIRFLENHNISYQQCFPPQPTNGTVILASPYMGEIYIDIPYDQSEARCKLLDAYLENPDGTMKLPNVGFWLYPLEQAMKNAEQDEPGYWDNM